MMILILGYLSVPQRKALYGLSYSLLSVRL